MTATQQRLAKKQKVDCELTKARTQLAQMRLSSGGNGGCRAPGELITKKLVEQQAAYLMITFRQKMLKLGASWSGRFVGLQDVHEAKRLIDEMARSTLTELAKFRKRSPIQTGWRVVEGDGQEEERIRPASGRRSGPGKRRRRFVARRRQRRCENSAPKAEIIGIIPIPDDVLARSNLRQLLLAQQAPARWRFAQFTTCELISRVLLL